MVFYKIEGIVDKSNDFDILKNDRSFDEIHDTAKAMAIKSEAYNLRFNGKQYIFISSIINEQITIALITKTVIDVKECVMSFLYEMGIEISEMSYEEITFNILCKMLARAYRDCFVGDGDYILEEFELSPLDSRFGRNKNIDEKIIEISSKQRIYTNAKSNLPASHIIAELDRIYQGKKMKGEIKGHPVHYILQNSDISNLTNAGDILLEALYDNRRIHNKRVCSLRVNTDARGPDRQLYNCVYRSSVGGAVRVSFVLDDNGDDDSITASQMYLEAICEMTNRYKNSVLTIFMIPSKSDSTLRSIKEYLSDMTFVTVTDTPVNKEKATEYFNNTAKKHGVRADKRLYNMLEYEDGYLESDLREMFDKWYSTKLKNQIFPQYSKMKICGAEVKKKAKGKAYDELNKMPGIEEAKKIINRAIKCHKAQKVFKVDDNRFSMNMVFTGNPGTAKTTVARLFARILRENDCVKTGVFVETGRADLVGKYVGWTAKTIKKKYRKAIGGVLFIDEAYSLLDDRGGSYGDEAINTIVQEMENHREDVITIFAGYTDRMEEFLERNPGLRSRISFHVPFPDYSTSDLNEIADVISGNMDLTLSEDAKDKLSAAFDIARSEPDFGNGRYVRNVIEKARMNQMARILDMEYESVSKSDISTIEACDIEIPKSDKPKEVTLGFCG